MAETDQKDRLIIGHQREQGGNIYIGVDDESLSHQIRVPDTRRQWLVPKKGTQANIQELLHALQNHVPIEKVVDFRWVRKD